MIDAQLESVWLDAARRGDQEAFGELVRIYEKRVFALTSRMCRNPDDAAEAAQDAFLAAWQGLPKFRGDSSFATWLYRLASNACVDLLRRENRRQADSLDEAALDLPSTEPSPQESAERKELREQVEDGLRQLPPDYRAVLVLREIHQLRYDEIAQALSLDVGTVKSRIKRGRKRLREILLQSGNFSAPPASNLSETAGNQRKEGRS